MSGESLRVITLRAVFKAHLRGRRSGGLVFCQQALHRAPPVVKRSTGIALEAVRLAVGHAAPFEGQQGDGNIRHIDTVHKISYLCC